MAVALLQPKDYIKQAGADSAQYSLAEAEQYTRWLATHHYENFQVVSFLLPKHLRQEFYNVYAFCRWADDLGDELGDPQESLELLGWWRDELKSMYRGDAAHPVFVALKSTVDRFEIPIEPFDRLIRAFEQDQTVTRYENFEELFDYCGNSANPVGHLVLYLCGYRDPHRQELSNHTCTALQLANFWQDIGLDLPKNRVYLPLSLLGKHGYGVEDLFAGRFDQRFAKLMEEAVRIAASLFRKGLPLIGTVDRRLALDLQLFSNGGIAILEKIRRQRYNVLEKRPRISKVERLGILLRCLPRLIQ